MSNLAEFAKRLYELEYEFKIYKDYIKAQHVTTSLTFDADQLEVILEAFADVQHPNKYPTRAFNEARARFKAAYDHIKRTEKIEEDDE